MKHFLWFIAIDLLLLNGIFAQQLSYSPFTRYGIGEFIYQGSIRNLSMGKTGIASISKYHVNKLNPASYGLLKHNSVLFEVSLFDEISVFRTPTEEQINNLSNIRSIYGAFPIIAKWWHTSIGLVPLAGMGYRIEYSDSIYTPDAGAGYTNIYDGFGSINEVYWGNTFSYKNKIHLGINTSYVFGSLTRNTEIFINEPDNSFQSLYIDKKHTIFRGFRYQLGAIYSDTLIKKIEDKKTKNLLIFSLGAVYSNKQLLNSITTEYIGRKTRFYNRSKIDTFFIDTIGANKIYLPNTYGAGISLKIFDQLEIEFNYMIEQWKNIEFFGQNFYNTKFLSIGMEYCRQPISTRYWRTLRYRIGYYQQTKYVAFAGKQLNEKAYTIGMAFPLKSLMFNFALVYGQQQANTINITHTFYQIHFGFSIYDIWFVKRKYL